MLQSIDDAGLKNKTLVIFTSDNGGERYSDMSPLKGKKFQLWEGGIRVPAMVRWPGKIKPNSITDQVAVTMDWTVTILGVAEVPIDKSYKFDGLNLLPVLQGGEKFDRTLYWRVTNRERWDAIRTGDWKYIRTPKEEGLYNLAIDKSETDNLKDSNPETFHRLKSDFQLLDKGMLKPYVFKK